MQAPEIHYRVPWRAAGSFPGAHASQQRGAGLRFRNHVPLADAPDPRRFDVRASLRDPFGRIQVRVFEQSSSIPVFVVADLSASMDYAGTVRKRDVIADFVACLSFSAWRTGDTFGFVGCGTSARAPLVQPPTFNRASGLELAQRLRGETLRDGDAGALLRAADYLGGRRALVFLLSDFHLPDPFINELLERLAYHETVPVVVWDEAEYQRLPGFGLARVTDPESGRSRLLFMRRALRERIRERYRARREALSALFHGRGQRPVFLYQGFRADEVSKRFLG